MASPSGYGTHGVDILSVSGIVALRTYHVAHGHCDDSQLGESGRYLCRRPRWYAPAHGLALHCCLPYRWLHPGLHLAHTAGAALSDAGLYCQAGTRARRIQEENRN